MLKTVVLLDGGNLRKSAQEIGFQYNNDFVERFAWSCVDHDREHVLRFLYYDCPPFAGEVALPVSGERRVFESGDGWLRDLAQRERFAVRRGILKFRGFRLRRGGNAVPGQSLTDEDFVPDFEQKGVDVRIALDIASYAHLPDTDQLVLASQDTDLVPAMKYARRLGKQMVVASLGNMRRLPPELYEHSDDARTILPDRLR
ncbi:MAG: NYN domain-containing protein [Alphaproteobacteria bacterium]|nr:NYN domain-containing protein [Alphaproteobacteria bacterium]